MMDEKERDREEEAEKVGGEHCQVVNSGCLSSMWKLAFLSLLPIKMASKPWEPH